MSIIAVPPHLLVQSWIQSLAGLLSQIPQLSNIALPPQSPLQSCWQGSNLVDPPTQFPHLSTSAEPPQTSSQSCSQAVLAVFPPTQLLQLSITAEPPQSSLQS